MDEPALVGDMAMKLTQSLHRMPSGGTSDLPGSEVMCQALQSSSSGSGAIVAHLAVGAKPPLGPSRKRSLQRQFSQLSVDEDVVLQEPVSSCDDNDDDHDDVNFEAPISSSDDDSAFRKFVLGHTSTPPVLAQGVTHEQLLQHAISVSAKPLRARPEPKPRAKKKAKPKSGKRPKSAAKAASKAASSKTSSVWNRVQMHLGETKSYIKTIDEHGCSKCQWHLTPKANAHHKRLTEFMAMAMKSSQTSFGIGEVHSILAAIKDGISSEAAIEMITKISDGDVDGSAADDDDDDLEDEDDPDAEDDGEDHAFSSSGCSF